MTCNCHNIFNMNFNLPFSFHQVPFTVCNLYILLFLVRALQCTHNSVIWADFIIYEDDGHKKWERAKNVKIEQRNHELWNKEMIKNHLGIFFFSRSVGMANLFFLRTVFVMNGSKINHVSFSFR